ncbi:MAG: glycosyltransferase [Acidobacteria bacterium]|nr:glycosyltransferase [Acidobacteriota bacterium]
MKVLHVIPAIAPRYGGPSGAIFTMCRALQQQAIAPLIATTNADGEHKLPVALDQEITYQQVPTRFFDWQWSQAFQYSRPLSVWLQNHVKDFQVAHIHAVFSHACLAAARACQHNNVPYIVRPLGSLDPWSLQQKPLRKKIFWHLGVKRMLHQAAAIHYTTLAEKRLAEDAAGLERGVVIPLGFDNPAPDAQAAAENFRARQSTLGDHPYLLFLSRIHPKKGLELLLESFFKLKQSAEFSDWKLVIAGDGDADYVASLQRLVQEHQANQEVLFVGWLADGLKDSAIAEAALLALPSYQENFGICLIEALRHGVPVLVSPHVNLASDIEEAQAGWVASLEPKNFLVVLGDALRAKDERMRRGQQGREFAKRFSATCMGEHLAALYQSIARPYDEA